MKRIVLVFSLLLALFFAFVCDKDKNNDINKEDPSYFFPLNLEYKWTYMLLNNSCDVSQDSFFIQVVNRNSRPEGSGWDLVSSGGGTTFVYRKGDTIFTREIGSTTIPSKVLVGPVRSGTFWRDARGYEYSILGLEDVPSPAAGGTYTGCAKVKRTISGDPKVTYIWWAPEKGKAKRTEKDQSGRCVSGEELRRLDKSPHFP
jgi:hypothetical protein